MQDVYRTVYADDPETAQAKTEALTPEQQAERFAVDEFIARVRTEARARYAHLPRATRRRLVYEAVSRAKGRVGFDRRMGL